MGRTKEWWTQLDAGERIELVNLEKSANYNGSGWNMPEGYSDCGMCSSPSSGGLCRNCLSRLINLINKANEGAEE